MHTRSHDFDCSRRFFLEKTAQGLIGAGLETEFAVLEAYDRHPTIQAICGLGT